MDSLIHILPLATVAVAGVVASDTRIWLAIIGLFLSLGFSLFGVAKYILALRIAPLEKTINENVTKTDKLQTDLVRQVMQVAEDNHKHRLAQQTQLNEIKLLMLEHYVKKEDIKAGFDEVKKSLHELHLTVQEQSK